MAEAPCAASARKTALVKPTHSTGRLPYKVIPHSHSLAKINIRVVYGLSVDHNLLL